MLTFLSHIRRNHALEHATINLLAERYPHVQVMGVSGWRGFLLLTNLDPEQVAPMAVQALRALQSGQSQLAIHRQCGTNMVTTAFLTVSATLLGFAQAPRGAKRAFVERLPFAMLLNIVALMIAPAVGRWIQRTVTTQADMAGVDIQSITANRRRGMHQIQIMTRQTA